MQKLSIFSNLGRGCRWFSSIVPKDGIDKAVAGRIDDSEWIPKDVQTHTGQVWDKNDHRLARFIDKPKQINEKFAIDLINNVAPTPTKDRVVWCDGGDAALGHPKVYINLDKPGNHTCGYCGLRFYKEDNH